MVYFAPLFMLTIAYLLGALIQKIVCDNDGRLTRTCLIGTFFLFVLWTLIVNVCDILEFSFDATCRVFSIVLLSFFVLSMLVCRKNIKHQLDRKERISITAVVIIGVICVVRIICYYLLSPDTKGDLTVETVNTVLATGSAFHYNPATGLPVSSVSASQRLMSLPLLYAYIANVFGAKASVVCYRVAPVWVYFLFLLVYSLYADAIFDKDLGKKLGTAFFVGGVGTVSLLGAFSEGSLFYYQALRGFTGETMCYSVLYPACIYECYYGFRNKRRISIISIIVILICSLFTMPWQRGLLPVAMEITICIMIAIGYRIRRYIRCKA